MPGPSANNAELLLKVFYGHVALWLTYRLIARRGRAGLPPREPYPVPWGTMDVVLVVLLYLVLFFSCNLALQLLRRAGTVRPSQLTMIAIACQASVHIATVLYVFQVVFRTRKAAAEALGLTSRDLALNTGRGLLAYAMCCPLLLVSVDLMNYLFDLPSVQGFFSDPFVNWITRTIGLRVQQQKTVILMARTESPLFFLTIAALAVVIAPLAEEIFFRSFLQQAVRRRTGEYAAIVITALVFAAVHMNLRFFVPLTVLGLVLSYLYSRTGSLAAPLAVHVLHNVVMIARILLAKQ